MKPEYRILSDKEVEKIISDAIKLLGQKGILIENKDGMEIFESNGLHADENGWVQIPELVIRKALATVPSELKLYDREGNESVKIDTQSVHFDPGSSALTFLEGNERRKPKTEDYIAYVKVNDQIANLEMQSTAFVPEDVPIDISDAYRLYLSLQYSKKPIVTGTFKKQSFEIMKNLLLAIRGSEEALREKPLAIFDACTTSPLRWSDLTTQSVIDAAKAGIPSTIISMPMMAASSPASIFSSIILHTAEILSGIVLSQLVAPGCHVHWGGSATVFDLRKGTAPLGTIENMLLTTGYAQVGRHLGIPTHGYMGLTDTKILDVQSGFESGFGIAMASLGLLNIVSGAGMIDLENCFSIEKLIIDNEIIGMAKRLRRGIEEYTSIDIHKVMEEYEDKKQLITHKSTRLHYRKEFHFPSDLVDRSSSDSWDGKSIVNRAEEMKSKYLASYDGKIDDERKEKLDAIMKNYIQ